MPGLADFNIRHKLEAVLALVVVVSPTSPALAGYASRSYHVGPSRVLDDTIDGLPVAVPSPSDFVPIVGIGVAADGDCYFWRADGTYTTGNPGHWGDVLFDYDLHDVGDGKTYSDIVTMAVGEYGGVDDRVFTFYRDQTFSVGNFQNLGVVEGPAPFSLPTHPDGRQRFVWELIGIGSNADGQFFAFFADKTVHEGTLVDTGSGIDFDWGASNDCELPAGVKAGHIIDVGIWMGDLTFSWSQDVERGDGHRNLRATVDVAIMDRLQRYGLPGITVAVSKNGRVVLEKGYGYRNFTTGLRMNHDTRGRIGSVSKMVTAWAAMHLDETRADFSVDNRVYNLLPPVFDDYQKLGIARHQPIVARAVAPDGTFFTWDHTGKVSAGTAADPDADPEGPADYARSLPLVNGDEEEDDEGGNADDRRMTPEDVCAIAIDDEGWFWIWYEDGTYSSGTSTDFEAHVPRDPEAKVALPSYTHPDTGQTVYYSMEQVVGIDFAPDGSFHVWYEDGSHSAGTEDNFEAHQLRTADQLQCDSFHFGIFDDLYNVRGVAISKSDSATYFFHANPEDPAGEQWALVYDDNYHCVDMLSYEVPAGSWSATKDWEQWYADMRVKHLLSHTSGLSRSGDQHAAERMFGYSPLTYRQVHQHMLATRKLKFAPGTASSYSNHGMGVVGLIIQYLSLMSYRDYVETHIIDGLNFQPVSDGQKQSEMWRHEYKNGVPEAFVDDPANDLGLPTGGWKAGAGALVRLMLRTDQDPDHNILQDRTLDLMEQQPFPEVSSFALGWNVDKYGSLKKDGATGGSTAFIIRIPPDVLRPGSAEISVALVTNINVSSAVLSRLAYDIAAATELATIGPAYDLY